LDQDAAELKMLAECLAAQHSSRAWVLMGHSTGCQDAVRCLCACASCQHGLHVCAAASLNCSAGR
jgi:hypothetical protein